MLHSKVKGNFSIYHYINFLINKVGYAALCLSCVALIFKSETNKGFVSNVRSFFIDISVPAANIAQHPLSVVTNTVLVLDKLTEMKEENTRLIEENKKLKLFYIEAIKIKSENKDLKEIMHFVKSRSLIYKTAILTGSSNKLYGNNAYVDAGLENDIKEESIVIGKNAMIGRIINVSNSRSRIMLITDSGSKIPVVAINSKHKGILAGNNSNLMKISYLPRNHKVKTGDIVYTSGDGYRIPPGIPVGIVTKVTKNVVSVKSLENITDTNIVTIIEY